VDLDEFRAFFGDLSGDFAWTRGNVATGGAPTPTPTPTQLQLQRSGGAEMVALRDALFAFCDE
jgi:hypothetical protein